VPKGTIIRLIADRDYGFIRTAQGEELLFPYGELEGVDYNSLREGQQVEFEVSQEPDGSCAVKVKLAQPKGE
jgi:cold shock CspA family protein